MVEDVNLAKIRTIREVIEKNLAIVRQALGIEAAYDNDLGELEAEPEIVIEEATENFPQKRLTVSGLAEDKKHLLALRNANKTRFLENQAMFAESVAKFKASRNKFIKKSKQGNYA